MSDIHVHHATRSFRAVFASTLLWNTQPHLVVFTLLFLQKGISLSQFFIIQSIGSITAFLLEVPTGILADRLGRKFSLVASLALGLILTPVFIVSSSLWMLYAASVLGGICGALRSGADEALFYDSLKEIGREEEYTRLNGSLRWWSGNIGIVASILGGVLATSNYAIAWWCWEGIIALAFICSLFIIEPKRSSQGHPPTIQMHLAESLLTAFRTPARYFVLYVVSVWLFFSIAFWLWQPYLRSIGVGVEFFGVIFALTGVASGFGARLVSTLEQRFSLRTVLAIPPLVLAITLAGQSACTISAGLCFLLLHSFASGIFSVVADHSIHSRIESATRATVLSVKNMLSTLLFALLSPIVGLMADTSSLAVALLLLALGVALVGAGLFIFRPQEQCAPEAGR
jgi:MFS family permease